MTTCAARGSCGHRPSSRPPRRRVALAVPSPPARVVIPAWHPDSCGNRTRLLSVAAAP
jgi:hypothetical protein